MFSLADPHTVRAVLSAAGYAGIDTTHAEAYGTWGRDAGDAAAFLLDSGPGRHLINQVGQDAQGLARRRLTRTLRPHGQKGALRLRSTAWLVHRVPPAVVHAAAARLGDRRPRLRRPAGW
ncbi:hypothetical protein ACWDZ4_28835 [Streptomyces sp. NPDC003016]